MVKKIALLIVFACTFNFAQDTKPGIEFSKDLQKLIEKYENTTQNSDNDTTKLSPIEQAMQEQIEIDKNKSSNYTKKDIYMKYFDQKEKSKAVLGNVVEGRAIYEKTCYKCHGTNADKSSYGNARVLIKLSGEDIVDELKNYARDSGYGKGTRMIMHSEALKLNKDQRNSIAAYIESLQN